MPALNQQKLWRVMDANFNRTKEGLRVCEDVCRFFLDQRHLTRQFKDVRHQLSSIVTKVKLKKLITARQIEQDVGKPSSAPEMKRSDVKDIFLANMQRVKESVRVLEEFLKLTKPKCAEEMKALRYQIYAIEKKVLAKL